MTDPLTLNLSTHATSDLFDEICGMSGLNETALNFWTPFREKENDLNTLDLTDLGDALDE